MNVKMPRNITRVDLSTKGPDFECSLAEPTAMPYYLQRVKLGITCREISDIFYNFSDPESTDYEVVRMMDTKFERQIQESPRFLRFDLPFTQLRAEYGEAYDQQTDIQGIIVHFMINIRRCELHLPYHIQAKSSLRFTFYRRMGLQAGRSVFNVRRIVLSDSEPASAAHLKVGGMLQHTFFATVVPVMDLCVDWEEHGNKKHRIAEVREASKVIEEGKQSPPMRT